MLRTQLQPAADPPLPCFTRPFVVLAGDYLRIRVLICVDTFSFVCGKTHLIHLYRVASVTVVQEAEWSLQSGGRRSGWLTLALEGCSVSIDIGSCSSGANIDTAAVRARLTKSLTKSRAILSQLQESTHASLNTPRHVPLRFFLTIFTGETLRRFRSKRTPRHR